MLDQSYLAVLELARRCQGYRLTRLMPLVCAPGEVASQLRGYKPRAILSVLALACGALLDIQLSGIFEAGLGRLVLACLRAWVGVGRG
eukprot:7974708-Alexandrium_andersonii.AAC.1